jgi:methionyl-tRNA formyltransferase
MEEEAKRSDGMILQLPNLIFMGTPDFAVPVLRKLDSVGARIHLVVTQPDRPRGRGKSVTPPPIKVVAEELGLPIYQPERVRRQDVLDRLCSCHAQCLVVAAFGQILPKSLLQCFPLGAINVHPSLLPRYRGAAPIQRAILSGDGLTGVSIMLLDEGMDTGPVLARQELPISDNDTYGALRAKLSRTGADLLCETLARWRSGSIKPAPQEDALATYAPPITKEDLRLSWGFAGRNLVNTIRAFDPQPGAFCYYEGKRLKMFSPSILPWKGEGRPGEIVGHTQKELVVIAGDGQAVSIGEVQPEGGRRLPAADYLRGHPMPPGTQLE